MPRPRIRVLSWPVCALATLVFASGVQAQRAGQFDLKQFRPSELAKNRRVEFHIVEPEKDSP